MDEFGNMETNRPTAEADKTLKGPIIRQQETETCLQDSDGYVVPNGAVDEINKIDSFPQTEDEERQPISTKDLISWSYQIARGMGYLSSKKVE